MSLPIVLFLCSLFSLAGLAILADLSTISPRRVVSGILWASPVTLLVLLSVGR